MAAGRFVVFAHGVRIHVAEPRQACPQLAHLFVHAVGNGLHYRQLLDKGVPRQRRLVGDILTLFERHQA